MLFSFQLCQNTKVTEVHMRVSDIKEEQDKTKIDPDAKMHALGILLLYI